MSFPKLQGPPDAPDLSVIIVNWNSARVLLECLRSLREGGLEGLAYEIIVVDNASTDNSLDTLKARATDIRLLVNDQNEGFGAASNRGMREAQGSWFLLLNPDTLVPPGAVARMLALVRNHPKIGMAGCKLVSPDGEEPECVWQAYAGRQFPKLADTGFQTEAIRPAGWVSGACMLVRSEVTAATGGFDAGIFLYGEDAEWCYRIWKAGWQVAHLPFINIIHLGGVSSGRSDPETMARHFEWGALYFRRKHFGSLGQLARQGWEIIYALRGIIYYGALKRVSANPRWRQKQLRYREKLQLLLSSRAWWSRRGSAGKAVSKEGRAESHRRSI